MEIPKLEDIAIAKKQQDEMDEFGSILQKYGIAYRIQDQWIVVGETHNDSQWILYISLLNQNVKVAIEKIITVLIIMQVKFKIVKNRSLISKINGFWHGLSEAGKIITIYTGNRSNALNIYKELIPLTSSLKGPFVSDSIRLHETIYAKYGKSASINNEAKEDNVDRFERRPNIPFRIPEKYKLKRRKSIIGKHYVPIKLIRPNPKGDLLLGVNIKKFAFTKCLIKQARTNCSIDSMGIDIVHKLIWQRKVIESVQGQISTAKLIDFCKHKDDYYLITEFIEGKTLHKLIKQKFNGRIWSQLEPTEKIEVLSLFMNIVRLINGIHEIGYLHRDITDTNFIVDNSGELFVIDFELAYSMQEDLPNPAFNLGTFGYASPDQLENNKPTINDDTYSLGAVLIFMLTTKQPTEIVSEDNETTESNLSAFIDDNKLTRLINACIAKKSEERITIEQLYDEIKMISNGIQQQSRSKHSELEAK